jgi:predicted cupin superfamily sugar epimerase
MDLRDPRTDPDAVIATLGLARHPEGGWYRETWRDAPADGSRGAGTAILFLLKAGEASHWHRVDATEIWHWHGGAPLALTLSPDGHGTETMRLGPDLAAQQLPQRIVPAHWWQAATSLGRWTLAGCTVSPGFTFAGFELAPPGWRPAPR